MRIFENSRWDPSQNAWPPEEETNRICLDGNAFLYRPTTIFHPLIAKGHLYNRRPEAFQATVSEHIHVLSISFLVQYITVILMLN